MPDLEPNISLILAGIGALSLRLAVEFFQDSKALSARADFALREQANAIREAVLAELEAEAIRIISTFSANPDIEWHRSARDRSASRLYELMWDKSRTGRRLADHWTSFQRWEDWGKTLCQLGTFINIAVGIGALAILLYGSPLAANTRSAVTLLAILILAVPLVAVIICWIMCTIHKSTVQRAITASEAHAHSSRTAEHE